MSAQSILFDFSIDPTRINGAAECKIIVNSIIQCLQKYFKTPKLLFDSICDDGFLSIYKDEKTIMSIRIFHQGLITLNIEYYKNDNEQQTLNFEVCNFHNMFCRT